MMETETPESVPPKIHRLATFQHSEFLEYVKARGLDKPCDVCGESAWVTPKTGDGFPSMVKMEAFREDEVVHLYIPRVCTQCSNTRLFNVSWLLAAILNGDADE